jgi:hypothetical protein
MIAIISAIGFGSIVAAVVGWYGVISNHRQAWINALRDDLAMFLRELEVCIMQLATSSLLKPLTSCRRWRSRSKTRGLRFYLFNVE